MIKRLLLVGGLLSASISSALAQLPVPKEGSTLDAVVAVVAKYPIFKSSIDAQAELFLLQRGGAANVSPDTLMALRKQILESEIDQKLLLAQADLDSITVSEAEVDNELDQKIKSMAARVGGESEVEKIYGKTISELKASPDLRQQTRDNLIVQQERFKVLPPPASISRQDVETFYKLYKDSLPPMGAKVDLSTIIKIIKTLPDQKDRSRKLALSLTDSLKHGADFAALAKRYSDVNAESGGDLGTFYPRGTFLPAVEEAAFKLQPGQISDVIETEQGFHIIKLIERRGEEVHIAQILIKPEVNAADQAAVRDTLMTIRDSALRGVDFSLLAEHNSDDPETRPFGGELGKISVENLDAEQKTVVDSLKEGEISMPIRIAFSAERTGFQIVKVNKKIPPHAISLEDDYRELEAAATQWKQTQDLQAWLARERTKVYVNVHDLAQFY